MSLRFFLGRVNAGLRRRVRAWLAEKKPPPLLEFDYSGFENKFRGNLDTEKQWFYFNMFPVHGLVLDLGCGRGEFVELMYKGYKRHVEGVDLDPVAVAAAKARGLPVECRDLFDRLNEAPDGSLAGVFMSHVVEHLETQKLFDLIALIARKLRPEGVFVAETPNPQCLLIFAESFYMDPTHLRPVHPLTLTFVLEQAGFRSIRYHHTSPATDFRLPALKGEGIENLAEFNAAVEKLNGVLFGFRDYGIIATR
jgi:SAM-dependent methyltransferase